MFELILLQTQAEGLKGKHNPDTALYCGGIPLGL